MNQQIIKQITTLNVATSHNQERKQGKKERMREAGQNLKKWW